MSLAANALSTFLEAKSLFGYMDDEQTKVETLIGIASSVFESFTRRKLAARDYSLLLDGTGRDTLILPEYPINSVTRLSVDPSRGFSADLDIPETDYQILSDSGMIRLFHGVFGQASSPAVVKCVFNSGYLSTHPDRVILSGACLEYVDWLKSRYSRQGSIGRKGEWSADRVSISFETDMPSHIRSRLEPFARIRL